MMDDTISRQEAIDVTDRETVSTNPDDFIYHEKFIDFMSDDEVSSFGEWQWSNGFNTALVAVKIGLEKLPSAQPEKVCIANITLSEEQIREVVEKAKNEVVQVLPSAEPEEDCDSCKYGYFGNQECNNCRMRYPSHYERRTDEEADIS